MSISVKKTLTKINKEIRVKGRRRRKEKRKKKIKIKMFYSVLFCFKDNIISDKESDYKKNKIKILLTGNTDSLDVVG